MKLFDHVLKNLANAFFLALLAAATGALAQDRYPTQPIKIVVPYPPGGSTDMIARQFAEQLTKDLGQPVLIDNRPGGGTNIGADLVTKSKADGHTLMFAGTSQVLNPIFGPVPAFDLMTAFEPVSLVAHVPFVVAANPKMPFNTGSELLSAAKASPGKRSISSAQLDLYVELLNSKAGINLLHVPYKGGAPATTDAISGQVDMVYALVPVLLPHIQGGRLKALAVTSAKRLAALPDVPSFAELGVDYDLEIWYGLLAPAGTPQSIVNRLASATQKIMSQPEVMQKVRTSGAEPAFSKPEEMKAMLRKDTAFWQQVAKSLPHLVQK